jgi:hypothetical protein
LEVEMEGMEITETAAAVMIETAVAVLIETVVAVTVKMAAITEMMMVATAKTAAADGILEGTLIHKYYF